MTLEHAAVTETSLMLHYEPDPVHMDRVIDKGNATPKADARHPVRNGPQRIGHTGGRGQLIAEACVAAVADICAAEFAD